MVIRFFFAGAVGVIGFVGRLVGAVGGATELGGGAVIGGVGLGTVGEAITGAAAIEGGGFVADAAVAGVDWLSVRATTAVPVPAGVSLGESEGKVPVTASWSGGGSESTDPLLGSPGERCDESAAQACATKIAESPTMTTVHSWRR